MEFKKIGDDKAWITQQRVYAPLGDLAEAIGADYEFDGGNTAYITYNSIKRSFTLNEFNPNQDWWVRDFGENWGLEVSWDQSKQNINLKKKYYTAESIHFPDQTKTSPAFTIDDAEKNAFFRTLNNTQVQLILAKHGLEPIVNEAYKKAKNEFIDYMVKLAAKKGAKEAVEKAIPLWGYIDTIKNLFGVIGIGKDYFETIYPTYQKYLKEEMEKVNDIPNDRYKCIR